MAVRCRSCITIHDVIRIYYLIRMSLAKHLDLNRTVHVVIARSAEIARAVSVRAKVAIISNAAHLIAQSCTEYLHVTRTDPTHCIEYSAFNHHQAFF